MHTEVKQRRSFLALPFVSGDLRPLSVNKVVRRILLFCWLLSGCVTANELPRSVSYIYIYMPDTQSWKITKEEDAKWMEGLIKSCNWIDSGDIRTSKYVFEINSQDQSYLGQLSDDLLYMSDGNVIYKCQLDNNSIKRLVRLYAP